jgi:hypothetical protein
MIDVINQRTIDTRGLKKFAKKNLRNYPVLRDLIAEDKDFMEADEFIIKSKFWIDLLEKSINKDRVSVMTIVVDEKC